MLPIPFPYCLLLPTSTTISLSFVFSNPLLVSLEEYISLRRILFLLLFFLIN